MTTLQIDKNVGNGQVADWKLREYNPPVKSFRAALCPEEEGGFSIFAIHLAGVVSQGDTEAEAVENIREAFLAMLESCQKHNEPLPFSAQPVVELAPDCRLLWIKVDG